MKHIIFENADNYPVAILLKDAVFNKKEIEHNYLAKLNELGVSSDNCISFNLKYDANGKASAKFIKDYLEKLLPALKSIGTTHLYVTDGAYFKSLTKSIKAEPYLGYVLPCKVTGYEDFSVVLGVNYQALIYNPSLQSRLDMSLVTLSHSLQGSYTAPGNGIIHSSQYPMTVEAIALALESLHQYPALTADIEAFSLRFEEAGIGSIAFAWDQHNGLAFACDYFNSYQGLSHQDSSWPGSNIPNKEVRALLLDFFLTYKGEITWHNATYDLKVIIFTLWMEHLLDTEGLLTGLDVMTRAFQDTKIIAYLATNSTAGNVLGLKSLAHAFAGNWAQEDIKDIRRIPLKDLLQYNLVDCLSTWYIKNKYQPVLVADKQETLYKDLMLPSLKTIIQMELTGMPMDPVRVQEVKAELEALQHGYETILTNSPVIKVLNLLIQTSAMEAANAKLKVKQHPLDKFKDVLFNPNSGPQVQRLLYEQMLLPVIDYTDTKQPSTGGDTLKKLLNHTTNPSYIALIEALIGHSSVGKILSSFIPAFEKGIVKVDTRMYLHGGFNLGGTVSGRLSSSKPNLQNIPAGSSFGKLIKSCFSAPKGWLFCGADFNSLEDMISALTTKDKNKLKVYTDGYDGHSLRAFSYFKDQCPDIIDTVESINSIKKKYPELRNASKGPTFLLTYGGTYHGMMSNLGWPEDKAKAIEKGYHELYEESDAFVQARLQQAAKDGYVEVAFGLRVRTPLLKQVMFGSKSMPYEAAAEGRTAGNALGQSYGLLNNRAANDFMQKVWASKYRCDIKPVALIHDAIYLLVRDDVDVVDWVNRELILSMQWQELPEIQHPTVKLGAALDVFWPSWAYATTLPNSASKETIFKVCQATKQELTN
jgi:DNA polymerase-1